jgi:hypothetical protein
MVRTAGLIGHCCPRTAVRAQKKDFNIFFSEMVATCRCGQNGERGTDKLLSHEVKIVGTNDLMTSCEGKLTLAALRYEAYV